MRHRLAFISHFRTLGIIGTLLWVRHDCVGLVTNIGATDSGDVNNPAPNEFRLAGVFPISPRVDIGYAHNGYDFMTRAVNSLNGGRGFAVKGKGSVLTYFRFNLNIDDSVTPDQQQARLDDLASLSGSYRAHFLAGSLPDFVFVESNVSLAHQLILTTCCVGPDYIYEEVGNIYLFGIQVSNSRYSDGFIKEAYLQQTVDATFAVIGIQDNPFTSTTCDAAVADITSQGSGLVFDQRYNTLPTNTGGTPPDSFVQLIQQVIDSRANFLLVCGLNQDSNFTVEVLDAKGALHDFAGIWMTTGPTTDDFLAQEQSRANYVLSAGQWHNTQQIQDDGFFGNSSHYVALYQAAFGTFPHYTAAGASACIHTLMVSIQRAFQGCDLSGVTSTDELLFGPPLNCSESTRSELGAGGYERVHNMLLATNISESVAVLTIFDSVSFNQDRRNVRKSPVTTQILEVDGNWSITAVLPIASATQLMVLPVPFAGEPPAPLSSTPGTHSHVDAIVAAVVPASVVAILVSAALVVWLYRRRKQKERPKTLDLNDEPESFNTFPSVVVAGGLHLAGVSIYLNDDLDNTSEVAERRQAAAAARSSEGFCDVHGALDYIRECLGGEVDQKYTLVGGRDCRASGAQAVVATVRSKYHSAPFKAKFFADHQTFKVESDVYQLLMKSSAIWSDFVRDIVCHEGEFLAPGVPALSYILMVKGTVMQDWIRQTGPSNPLMSVWMLGEIASQVAVLHQHNLVHRDIKPGNVIFVQEYNSWLLIDYGCAVRSGTTCVPAFTLHFAPPEVIRSTSEGATTFQANFKADVWSVGVMAFEMFTGQLIFPFGATQTTMRDILSGRAPFPHETDPTPLAKLGRLRKVVQRMLSRVPEDRPTMAEVAGKLNAMAVETGATTACYATNKVGGPSAQSGL